MKKILSLLFVLFFYVHSHAQCGPGVPVFTVNLTGNPSGTWISPNVIRNDNCCGTSNPNVCVKFVITLDPGAVGINFNIASGAVPGGAMFYQINCGPQTAVGQPICLSGPGPHVLTFCKPGNNSNTYQITSVPAPVVGNDITINQGCQGVLSVTGFSASTVSWHSVFPGAPGAYNSYLSCVSGCATTTVTPNTATPPPYVDYVVCGTPSAPCMQSTVKCDPVRFYFNPTLTANILPSNPTVCFGQTTASLTVVGGGGTPPYSYLWSNGATSQNVTVGSGSYAVLLSDASGCPPVSANVQVTSFTVPISANAGPNKIVCIQNPATSISGTITGATGGIWSGGQGSFTPSNTTLANMTYSPTSAELAAGFVNLVLSSTGNGSCPGASDTVRISYQNFTGPVSVSGTDPSCFGGSNGTATVSATGTVTPYSYSWNSVPQQTTATASNLGMGVYNVTVTDGIGCTYTTSLSLSQPLPVNASYTIANVRCAGALNGSISVTPTGGTAPYTYSWSPGGAGSSSLGNIPAGSYSLTIRDSHNCVYTQTFAVTQPPPLVATLSITPVSCFNGNNGSITASVSGGTGAYQYSWLPAGGNGTTAAGLTAGSYTLTATDANNCSVLAVGTVTAPTVLQVAVSTTNEACNYLNNGQATAAASGGTPAYSYSWSPGGLSGSSVTGLSSGVYTLTATDAKGCTVTTPVTITEPPTLTCSVIGITNVNCFGGANGSITLNGLGGTPGYTYQWQPIVSTGNSATGLTAGTYSITLKDLNGCTTLTTVTVTQPPLLTSTASSESVTCYGGSNGIIHSSAGGGTAPYTYVWSPSGISGQNVINVSAGVYTVTVTDSKGCTSTAQTTVLQPPAVTLSITVANSTCSMANGQATVSVSGGIAPYTYQWTPIGGTAPVATGLPAGTYNVSVTDANGCVTVGGSILNDNAGPNATMLTTTNVSCHGGTNGSATVGTSGGTGPFTYTWLPYGGNSPTANGLAAGTYTVTVTDSNGCQSLATTSPAITEPPLIQISLTPTNVSCFGGSNGQIQSTVTGGNPGYTYTWTPGGSSASQVTGLSAGTYTLQVADANGCIATQQATVTQPAVLTASISSSSNVSCFGGANGTAAIQVNGGTAPYSYNWTSGSNGSTATGLTAGSYTVFVTDSKSCVVSSNIAITQPSTAVAVATTATATSCYGGSNGAALANASGGTPPYTYSWASGPNTALNSGLPAGTRMVTATDNNGCTANAFATILQPTPVTATMSSNNATCGNANGSISAFVSGGTAPYTYSWTPGTSTSYSIGGIMPGTYSVAIRDSKNCPAQYSASIVNIPGPVASLSSTTAVSCYGGNNGSATITHSGGTAPYYYNWQPYGGTNAQATGLVAGNYTCTVFDSHNCSSSVTLSISQPPVLSLAVPGHTPPLCNGAQNGSMTATASGGVAAYTYTWLPSGGNGATTTGIAAGAYTVITADSHGCLASITTSLSQPPTLLANLVSTVNPSCYNGTNGSALANASGGTAPYQYAWQTTPVQNTAQATGLAQGTYSLIVTDSHSCTATLSAHLTQPSQVATLAGAGDTICLGQSAVISAQASGGNGNYIYLWNPPTGGSAGTQTVSPAASTNYTVTAYDQNGCMGVSGSIHVEVYSLLAGSVQAAGNSPICPGNGTLIYATVSGNTGPVTYQWTNNLGTGPGGYWVVPAQPTTYVVTVSNTCGTTVKDSVRINFNPPPTVLIDVDTFKGCVPLTIQFSDLSVTGNPADPIDTWSWSFGDGATASTPNPSHTYTSTGTFSVVLNVTTGMGCTNSNAGAPLLVTVHPKPTAAFTVNSTHLDIPFDVLQCTNQSQGAVSYNWFFGDGANSTLVNPSHAYNSAGQFYVDLIATNAYGCKDTARVKVETNTTIVIPTAFTPNQNSPSGGYYNQGSLDNDIFFPYTSDVADYHFMIFNRWGELIFETHDFKQGWDGYYRGKTCQEGVYAWKIDLKWNNGKTFNKVGDVTLLR